MEPPARFRSGCEFGIRRAWGRLTQRSHRGFIRRAVLFGNHTVDVACHLPDFGCQATQRTQHFRRCGCAVGGIALAEQINAGARPPETRRPSRPSRPVGSDRSSFTKQSLAVLRRGFLGGLEKIAAQIVDQPQEAVWARRPARSATVPAESATPAAAWSRSRRSGARHWADRAFHPGAPACRRFRMN